MRSKKTFKVKTNRLLSRRRGIFWALLSAAAVSQEVLRVEHFDAEVEVVGVEVGYWTVPFAVDSAFAGCAAGHGFCYSMQSLHCMVLNSSAMHKISVVDFEQKPDHGCDNRIQILHYKVCCIRQDGKSLIAVWESERSPVVVVAPRAVFHALCNNSQILCY